MKPLHKIFPAKLKITWDKRNERPKANIKERKRGHYTRMSHLVNEPKNMSSSIQQIKVKPIMLSQTQHFVLDLMYNSYEYTIKLVET